MTKNHALSNDEKVTLLRELCQGYGMTSPDSFIEHEGKLRQLIDVDAKRLDSLFKQAADAMTDSKYKDAFLNALWGNDLKNLTERRTDFLAKDGDITYRTLVRHEQEGAEIFLKFLEAQTRSTHVSRPTEGDDETDPDIEALRMRVTRLESVVYLTVEALNDANKVIHELITGTSKGGLFTTRFEESFRDYTWGVDTAGKSMLDHLTDMPGHASMFLRHGREQGQGSRPSSESQPDQD